MAALLGDSPLGDGDGRTSGWEDDDLESTPVGFERPYLEK